MRDRFMKKPKLKTKRLGDIEYTENSGNVFADLGIDNPEEALAKSEIVLKIQAIIKKKKLTQAKAAKILKIVCHRHTKEFVMN